MGHKNTKQEIEVFGHKLKNDVKILEQEGIKKIRDFNADMEVRLETTVEAKLMKELENHLLQKLLVNRWMKKLKRLQKSSLRFKK